MERHDMLTQGMIRLIVQNRVLRRIVMLKVMSMYKCGQQLYLITFRSAGTCMMSHSTFKQNSDKSIPMSIKSVPFVSVRCCRSILLPSYLFEPTRHYIFRLKKTNETYVQLPNFIVHSYKPNISIKQLHLREWHTLIIKRKVVDVYVT